MCAGRSMLQRAVRNLDTSKYVQSKRPHPSERSPCSIRLACRHPLKKNVDVTLRLFGVRIQRITQCFLVENSSAVAAAETCALVAAGTAAAAAGAAARDGG